MQLIADGLLIATALTAGLYCLILARRLRKLGDSETGIAQQIKLLNTALEETKSALADTRSGLGELRSSARGASERLARESNTAMERATQLEQASEIARITMQRLVETERRVANMQRELDQIEAPAEAPEVKPGRATLRRAVDSADADKPADKAAAAGGASNNSMLKVERMSL